LPAAREASQRYPAACGRQAAGRVARFGIGVGRAGRAAHDGPV